MSDIEMKIIQSRSDYQKATKKEIEEMNKSLKEWMKTCPVSAQFIGYEKQEKWAAKHYFPYKARKYLFFIPIVKEE